MFGRHTWNVSMALNAHVEYQKGIVARVFRRHSSLPSDFYYSLTQVAPSDSSLAGVKVIASIPDSCEQISCPLRFRTTTHRTRSSLRFPPPYADVLVQETVLVKPLVAPLCSTNCWSICHIIRGIKLYHFWSVHSSLLGRFSSVNGEHTDRADPLHCDSLLTRGTWLDDNHRNWQPEGVLFVVQAS